MKDYRRKFLAYQDSRMSSRGVETGRTDSSKPNQAAAPRAAQPQPKLNRKQRRRNAVFNRQLKRRLEKDGTPVRVETEADGGLHITLSKEALEMRHGDEDTPEQPEEVLLPTDGAGGDSEV